MWKKRLEKQLCYANPSQKKKKKIFWGMCTLRFEKYTKTIWDFSKFSSSLKYTFPDGSEGKKLGSTEFLAWNWNIWNISCHNAILFKLKCKWLFYILVFSYLLVLWSCITLCKENENMHFTFFLSEFRLCVGEGW